MKSTIKRLYQHGWKRVKHRFSGSKGTIPLAVFEVFKGRMSAELDREVWQIMFTRATRLAIRAMKIEGKKKAMIAKLAKEAIEASNELKEGNRTGNDHTSLEKEYRSLNARLEEALGGKAHLNEFRNRITEEILHYMGKYPEVTYRPRVKIMPVNPNN